MQYIEGDVKIEIIDESDGFMHETAYTVGLGRCATRLPAFTNEELRAGLGDEVYAQIEGIFADIN